MTEHEEKAIALFRQGYNCSQALLAAFCDVTGMPEQEALRLASSFGGGMGRLREVCGALTGAFMAAGLLYGYDEPDQPEQRAAHYARIQALAAEFRAQHGTILCRELLKDIPAGTGGAPAARTEEFYQTRPCLRIIADTAAMLDRFLLSHPPCRASNTDRND